MRTLLVAASLSLMPSLAVAQVPSIQRIAYDYTAMYEALSPSIVKIHTDSGTGSGFLVTESGMFATNHHVVRNARYLAVEFTDGRKVPAEIVTLDARNDLAIVKVNPAVLRGIRALPLLSVAADVAVKAGLPVVAFGSPLSQTFLMTQGIVSKVEPAVLLGDFLIEPGNSGGPLVNLDGTVIGINTFGQRGISGAVRVNVLRDILATPIVANYAGGEPAATELPTTDRSRYPTDILKKKILTEPLELSNYVAEGGRFTVTALTPVLLGKIQVQDDLQQAANRYARRGKKIKDERFDPTDEPFYDWHRNADRLLDVAVTFEVRPDFGQTAGSAWMSALSAFSAGASGSPYRPTRQTIEFKAEFQELRLYRDGDLIQPITPGRGITEQSINSGLMTFVDEAYSGMYSYHPAVFMTGKSFKLDIYDAREPGRVHRSITLAESSKLIQQVRRDFEGVIASGAAQKAVPSAPEISSSAQPSIPPPPPIIPPAPPIAHAAIPAVSTSTGTTSSTPAVTSQLQGSTPEQVRAAMGPPTETRTLMDGRLLWIYKTPGGIQEVFFTPSSAGQPAMGSLDACAQAVRGRRVRQVTVRVKETPIFVEPRRLPQALVIFRLGTTLSVAETVDGWFRISFGDSRGDRTGYVQCGDVELVP